MSYRLLGGRGAAALLLGTALSVGGITETLDNVPFLVQKDLDAVRVVRVKGDDEKVVASLKGNFAGNTVFKLAQVLPDRFVSRELAMFDDKWIATERVAGRRVTPARRHRSATSSSSEMHRINEPIRAEFFAEEIPYGELIHEKAQKVRRRSRTRRGRDRAGVALQAAARARRSARAGLMQLMPRTGRWMGARNLYDPEQNIDAGVRYIKYLDARFDGDLNKTIAAYNGGEGNVQRYQRHPPVPRDPPVREEGHEELRQAHPPDREVRAGPARRLGAGRGWESLAIEMQLAVGGAAVGSGAAALTRGFDSSHCRPLCICRLARLQFDHPHPLALTYSPTTVATEPGRG